MIHYGENLVIPSYLNIGTVIEYTVARSNLFNICYIDHTPLSQTLSILNLRQNR